MPYLPKAKKDEIDAGVPTQCVGELTYELQQVIQQYLVNKMMTADDGLLRYAHLADCTAALEQCKLDFQRRVVEPYETRKCVDNDDVWETMVLNG